MSGIASPKGEAFPAAIWMSFIPATRTNAARIEAITINDFRFRNISTIIVSELVALFLINPGVRLTLNERNTSWGLLQLRGAA